MTTRSDFMQFVQTEIRLTVPFLSALTRCRFGLKRRFVTLCAWLTLLPESGFLPHISHTLDIIHTPLNCLLLQMEKQHSYITRSIFATSFFVPRNLSTKHATSSLPGLLFRLQRGRQIARLDGESSPHRGIGSEPL